jgi:hypothetical protein
LTATFEDDPIWYAESPRFFCRERAYGITGL